MFLYRSTVRQSERLGNFFFFLRRGTHPGHSQMLTRERFIRIYQDLSSTRPRRGRGNILGA